MKLFRPLRLQVEISSVCNYRCQSCLLGTKSRPRQIMSLFQFQEIILEAKPVYLVITGIGESLLNKDLCEMIHFAKKKKIIVKMDTNGLILTKEFSKRILSTGLDYLSISLNTFDEQVYNTLTQTSGNLPIVLGNLSSLMENKKKSKSQIKLEVTILISKLNIESLPEAVEKVNVLGLDFVSCSLARRRFDTANDIFILEEQDKEKKAHYVDIFRQSKKRAKELGLVGLVKSISWILDLVNNKQSKAKKPCYLGVYNSFIFSDGMMLPCCAAVMGVLSSNNYLKAMGMGNVFTDSFMNVWHGKKAQRVRRSILEKREVFAYCKECTYDESGLFKCFYRLSKLFYN